MLGHCSTVPSRVATARTCISLVVLSCGSCRAVLGLGKAALLVPSLAKGDF